MLTDTAIRGAKPKEKPVKLFDGGGLYIIVAPTGSRWWRLKYRHEGREKLLSLGTYPAVGLKDARSKRDEARKLIAAGIDPSASRKARKASRGSDGSLEAIAREYGKFSPGWTKDHTAKLLGQFERDVFPWLGARPIGEITAPMLLAVLRRVESRGALRLAHRILWDLGRLFAYAIATGCAERNPATDIRGALPPPIEQHHPAITDPKEVGALLRAIDGYRGSFVTRCALRLAPLVFVRPGELRAAQWSEIDLDAAEWRIAAGRMKTREPHLVPLAVQALATLRELYPLTGHGQYVFPSLRTATRPLSENAINAALRRLGYTKHEITGHGFRAMARTILDEVLGVRPDFIEHQLAHAVRDPLGRAYNRTTHLPERRRMMQAWADYLDGLKGVRA